MVDAVVQPSLADAHSSRVRVVRNARAWERRYASLLALIDVAAACAGVIIATVAVDRGAAARALWSDARTVSAVVGGVALVATWLAAMSLSAAYDVRSVGIGSEEYKRVASAAIRVFAFVAAVVFVFGLDLDVELAALFVGIATALELVGRRVARRRLHDLRSRGRCLQRALVVGAESETAELVAHLRHAPYAGLAVVAACVPHQPSSRLADFDVPVAGAPEDVLAVLGHVDADTVIVADSHTLSGDGLRELAWDLEGSGIDLIVAPAVTEVAGPRISVRPIAGLPLLHVEEPELTGGQRLFKEVFDRVSAVAGLVVLSPLLVAVAVLVRTIGTGPVLFRQVRIGRDGREFVMLKFRTMVDDAESQLTTLRDHNEHDGVLFKIRNDPRVTRLGRWLRRHSLDELPQLWNVLRGDMSVVGPRPPLPSEVAQYGTAAHRRLLVKPGMTGLWQVSGRAELSWEESVRLDLFYVENWSPALDAQILWRTMPAVIRGRGAY